MWVALLFPAQIINFLLFIFQDISIFYAPFFTTWFCSLGTLFIFPIYLIGMLLTGAKSSKIQNSFKDGIQGFRNKGITLGKATLCTFGLIIFDYTKNLFIVKIQNLKKKKNPRKFYCLDSEFLTP